MFSVEQKREISDAVQKILRDTKHPELPEGEIEFVLHVDGAESWSWAVIYNNESALVGDSAPDSNPYSQLVGLIQPTQPKKDQETDQ